MIIKTEEDYARPVTGLALRLLALTVVRPGELRGAFGGLNGRAPLWRIAAARMKGIATGRIRWTAIISSP